MLKVRLLVPTAKAPTVAHPGEDLGYDVYAAAEITIPSRSHGIVSTGIAIEVTDGSRAMGALLRDKSSMAAKRLALTGGVIDAGYRGEILIVMVNLSRAPIQLRAGEKIAQMIPVPVLTGAVEQTGDLEDSLRAAKGFGSSGR